jgi:hypothetical protein
MEWSLRRMRAYSVMGMWQEMHRFPTLPVRWCVWAVAFLTRSPWQGRQASLAA